MIAIAVTNNKNRHSTVVVNRSPAKPISELMAMMNRDVPDAVFIGSRVNNTRAGIIRKPPPAPTSPVRKPMSDPSRIVNGIRMLLGWFTTSFLPRIMEIDARIIKIANTPSNKRRLVTTTPLLSMKMEGIAGTTQRRVTKIVMMDGMPNNSPVLMLTSCSLYFGIAPARLVVPTMKSE